MGQTVLDASTAAAPDLRLYAHCRRDVPGAVSVFAINTSRRSPNVLKLSEPAERYTLDAARLQSATIRLNGKTLVLTAGDELPRLEARTAAAGEIRLAPATITFLLFPNAENPACQ
jgi:hypothetical protein